MTVLVGGLYPSGLYPPGLYPSGLYPRFSTEPTEWIGLDYPLTGDIDKPERTADIEVLTRTVTQDPQITRSVLTSNQTVRTGEILQIIRTATFYDINKERTGILYPITRTGDIFPQKILTGDIDQ